MKVAVRLEELMGCICMRSIWGSRAKEREKERKREMERRDGEMRQKADCRLQMATVWCLVVFFFLVWRV